MGAYSRGRLFEGALIRGFTVVKARKRSIAVAWIDYRNAYDMVPHSWIVECLKSIGVNEEITVFMKE